MILGELFGFWFWERFFGFWSMKVMFDLGFGLGYSKERHNFSLIISDKGWLRGLLSDISHGINT